MPPFNIQQLGALGNGTQDDTPHIQKALDGPDRHLFLPPGSYKITTTLRIGSNTRLDLHPQARLLYADAAGTDLNSFLITNSDHDHGNTDIEITGGIWNANNPGNPRVTPLIQPGAYTGVAINFRNVRRLIFSDALLLNAESYFLRLTAVTDFLIEKIRLHSVRPRNNNDGIHLAGFCENGTIRHIRGLGPNAPNDDMVALNADDALQRVEVQGGLCGPIRNINVYDLHADHCHTFVRMLSTVSPITNILVDNVKGGCDVAAINLDGGRGCRVQMFDPADPQFARGVGQLRDIRISNLHVYKVTPHATALLNLQQRAANLTITNFNRDLYRDASPKAPTVLAQHLPDHRLQFEGLTLVDLESLQQLSTAPHASAPYAEGHPHRGHTATISLGLDTAARLQTAHLDRLTLISKSI